jgi:hypothetical protein
LSLAAASGVLAGNLGGELSGAFLGSEAVSHNDWVAGTVETTAIQAIVRGHRSAP